MGGGDAALGKDARGWEDAVADANAPGASDSFGMVCSRRVVLLLRGYSRRGCSCQGNSWRGPLYLYINDKYIDNIGA